MNEPRVTKKDLPRLCADAIGVAHFLVANALVLVGEFTSALDELGNIFPGLQFVFRYLDFPISYLLTDWAPGLEATKTKLLIYGEVVIVLSSMLYGFVIWLLVYAFMGDD